MRALLCIFLLAATSNLFAQSQFVDPFIGVRDDISNCVIGPQLPFGSINPSPHTIEGGHDGYNPRKPIRGFGQLHASGTGWGKYGQFLISPQTGLATTEQGHDSEKEDELAKPYEYSVSLKRYGISVSVAPEMHSAMYQIVFPATDSACVLIDLTHNIPQHIASYVGGKALNGKFDFKDLGKTIVGSGEYTGGFGGGSYPLYFVAKLSKKPLSYGTFLDNTIQAGENTLQVTNEKQRMGGYVQYANEKIDTLYLKIAVSFKSSEQANFWLNQEIPLWDYKNVVQKARDRWDHELSKIEINGTNKQKKIFYTAMYHAHLMPRNRTNDFQGYGNNTPVWDDHYAVWDTWRTVFPLMALINQNMVADNVNSFIARFNKNGYVRDAFIAGIDMAEEQGGNNIDNIIAEAWMKQLTGINWDEAYRLLKNNAEKMREGWQGWGNFRIVDAEMGAYKTNGWIPSGIMSCSKTLEYAYNDYLTAQVAKGLGYKTDYEKYLARSEKWQYLWSPNAKSDGFNGFIVPRKPNGDFESINLKKDFGSWNNYFYEGNSWTYSYFVPHEFDKLVYLNGGQVAFAEKLQHAFENNLIHYGNEPAFLTPYSFIYANRPDLASYYGKLLARKEFTLDGYPGNEDSGAMSAWYIFTTLGLFPNAGQNIYYLIGPSVDNATIKLSNGKKINIIADNLTEENIYVKECFINGKKWEHAWIKYDCLKNGAELRFEMAPKPTDWAKNDTLIYTSDTFKGIDTKQPLEIGELGRKQNYDSGFLFSPNPLKANTKINCHLPPNCQDGIIKILDLEGKILWKEPFTSTEARYIRIDYNFLSPGLYLAIVERENTIVKRQKIVITI